jgi:hypothetical protein
MFFIVFGNYFSQKEIAWDDLDFESQEVWSVENQVAYNKIIFEDKHRELDSTVVRIKGKINPIDFESGYYVLCRGSGGAVFCVFAEADERIEISFLTNPAKFDLQKEFLIEGLFILNEFDILSMTYKILNAKIIE